MYCNIMNIKSSKELVEEANKSIKTMNPEEIKSLIKKNEITLIDIRGMFSIKKKYIIKVSS